MITFKRFTIAASLICGLTSANAVLIQDFELVTTGVTGIDSGSSELADALTPIFQRSDGTGPNDFLPISPSVNGGDYFLEVIMGYEGDDGAGGIEFITHQGDRVKWNDAPQVGAFQSGSGFQVDVFFDETGYYGADDGFYIQTTLLDDTNSFVIDGGGFGVRLVDVEGTLTWQVGADGDVRGFSGVTGGLYDITDANLGWYTMETIWVENGTSIDQINSLYDVAGTMVFSETLASVADVVDVGQVGAAVIGSGDIDGTLSRIGSVAIDNLRIVPEPGVYALLAGYLALACCIIRRRKN
ncbi:hypothetical protein ACWPKS_08150 [Coraliomargarita sp. W4R72]